MFLQDKVQFTTQYGIFSVIPAFRYEDIHTSQ
jgi:hypothetical protein